MTISEYVFTRSHSIIRNHDDLIMLGYAAFLIVATVAIYFAAGGPGASEAEIASAVILP